MKDKLRELLQVELNAQNVFVTDDSAHHSNHPEAIVQGGGHFSVLIVSNDFDGLTRLDRHRLVNTLVFSAFSSEIHALAIKAMTPSEYSVTEETDT